MAETVPSSQALRRAKLFWEQAQTDRKAAQQKFKARAHLESGYLNFQAALNALAAVCYLNGKFQLPSHSTAQMAALCAGFDPRFEAIREASAALEAVQERSPFDAEQDVTALADLSRTALENGGNILDAVRAYLKERKL